MRPTLGPFLHVIDNYAISASPGGGRRTGERNSADCAVVGGRPRAFQRIWPEVDRMR